MNAWEPTLLNRSRRCRSLSSSCNFRVGKADAVGNAGLGSRGGWSDATRVRRWESRGYGQYAKSVMMTGHGTTGDGTTAATISDDVRCRHGDDHSDNSAGRDDNGDNSSAGSDDHGDSSAGSDDHGDSSAGSDACGDDRRRS